MVKAVGSNHFSKVIVTTVFYKERMGKQLTEVQIRNKLNTEFSLTSHVKKTKPKPKPTSLTVGKMPRKAVKKVWQQLLEMSTWMNEAPMTC